MHEAFTPARRWLRATRTLLLILAALTSGRAAAGDWPCWRGPGGVGVSDEKGVPVRDLGRHVLWTWRDPDLEVVDQWQADAPVYASPVVAHGRLYIRSWKTLHAFGPRGAPR